MYFKMRERKSPQLSDPSSLHFGGLLLLPSTPSSNTTIWCAERERENHPITTTTTSTHLT
jgi:hypothetical protein